MVALTSLARAALRLSPRQIAYHVKRKLRNEFALRAPSAYGRYITRTSRSLPPLNMRSAGSREAAIGIANAVAPYYHDEYIAVLDDAAHGRFTFFGQAADFGRPEAIDWHHTVTAESDFHLWRMKLGHMGFVCPMLMSGDHRHHEAVAAILSGYRERSSFGTPGCFSSYWFPYSVSHRILAILSGYVMARQKIPNTLQGELEAFLRWNAAFVSANVEHELRNNHVERNLAALCFYYTCAESVPAATARRLDREVRRIIEACVLADGLIAERSAMYQGLTVMALDVFARTPFLTDKTRAFALATHAKAIKAWATMTHPDGEIALFNDSWFGEVPQVSQIPGHAHVQPATALPTAGYARIESSDLFVLMDAGPIGPKWNPGHGHADFLSVEADVSGLRFIVDPGTFQYSTGPRRTFERSATSHNGPQRRGVEPVEYTGCFRVGRMSEATLELVTPTSASGRLTLPGDTQVSRTVTVASGLARVSDVWSDAEGDEKVRLTIPGNWELVGQKPVAAKFRQGATTAIVEVSEGFIDSIEEGDWSHHYLASEPATILVLTPDPPTHGPAHLVWEIRKMETE